MSRQSIPPQTNQPYTNGHYEAPLEVSGVSLHRPPIVHKSTVFGADLPLLGFGPLMYALQRFQLGGLATARYLAFLWAVIALLAVIGIIPGGWVTASLAALLLIAQIGLGLRYRRQHYVSFTGEQPPTITGHPLDIREKVSVYATGLYNVEGRYQHFSLLPGFYRTFATGEHALLCLVNDRKWLALWSWPSEETGMWYAFVNPADIRALSWGKLHFGTTTLPAIAVTYQLEIPPSQRSKNAELRQELLYIATPEAQDAQRIYADLISNLPADQVDQTVNAMQLSN